HLGDSVNSASWEFAPFVAPDGSYIIFRSDRPGGYGRGDLWVCFAKPDGAWTEAQNLGAEVNSGGDEGYPSVSNDGKYLFWVSPLPPGYAYYWISMSVVENLRPDTVTNVDGDQRGEELPYTFELTQNYPNPFNPTTTFEYSLPERSHVTIEIHNALGQRVHTIVDCVKSAGSYAVTWNGVNSSGNPVASGIYLYRLQAGEYIETKKMLLLK
ncbi:MAG: PD40 domain-containing protein, partial [Candidatus Zixiibacteriota bacterium]